MTEPELILARNQKWRLNGNHIRTIEDAREFIEDVGFCLIYPLRPPLLLPTFIGAFVGVEDRLPTSQLAFSDPRSSEATGLMVRLLRERAAYEANPFDENHDFLLAASVFPYFYALVGERNPKQPPKPGTRSPYSQLASDTFAIIQSEGPISKQKLLQGLGGGISTAAIDKALAELWSKLRITRVDYDRTQGSYWDVLQRWAPVPVREGVELSNVEALSGLLSKYLDCVIAAEPAELESFFGHFVARSRIKDAVNALLAARELSFVNIAGKSMLQITPSKSVPQPAPRRAVR